jgi:hypothetical protein
MARDSVPRDSLVSKGFDESLMKLVVPSTPIKPPTPGKKAKDRWIDFGLHMTISYHGVTKNKAGAVDDITEAMERHNDKPFDFCMDTDALEFYIGNRRNDEAVGAVFYVSYKLLDGAGLVNEIRALLGLGTESHRFKF